MKSITSASPLENRITEVIVFLAGAQVTRSGSLPAMAGTQSFVFKELPGKLQPESIQATAAGGVIIRSVEHALNYLKPADQTADIAALKEKLKDLEARALRENSQIGLGKKEEELFTQNMDLAGHESGLRAEDLKSTVLFFNERMAAIQETRMACQERLKDLNEEISAVKKQLGGFSRTRLEPVSNIIVTVEMNSEPPENQASPENQTSPEDQASPENKAASGSRASAGALTLSYFVPGASWHPSYDIRATDTAAGIDLHYKANVQQKTGEDWNAVKLTLSTGNPSMSAAPPEMLPWYLNSREEVRAKMLPLGAAPLSRSRASAEYHGEDDGDLIAPLAAAPPAPLAEVSESATSVEYSITSLSSIASGDNGKDVEVMSHALQTQYRCFCAPKLKRDVFWLAAVSGWERLNLVAGSASIFFENRYVGRTFIDPRRAEETIDLSLGPDPSVAVTRVRGKDFTAKTLTGNHVKQTRQWELAVRNLKASPIDMELKDQIPVSKNKQITVNAAEISGAELEQDTGILTWKFTLQPAEAKTLTVKYVVTSPKDMFICLE